MKVQNVAIFPAEAENAFELFRSLRYAPRFKVIGLSSHKKQAEDKKNDQAPLIFEHHRGGLPFINEADFLEELCKTLQEEGIDFIFPSHDSVAVFLQEHKEKIPAKILCSPLKTARLCRDKAALYTFFQNEPFCPKVFESLEEVSSFPIFLKNPKGQGGQGCFLANNAEEAQNILKKNKDLLLCEYLPGEEFTIDCFSNAKGELLFAGARSRDVVKMGIACVSSALENTNETTQEILHELAKILNEQLDFNGLWFFQAKADKSGNFKLLEVSTRASTGMGLYRQLGINFAQLALYEAMALPTKPLCNPLTITAYRTLQTRYLVDFTYDAAYIDLDDTLIVRGAVNTKALAFVYQCINLGKKVFLISRHDGDIAAYLQKFRIASQLFDGIIHLVDKAKKSAYIKDKKAIFIDNLFIERQEVFEALGIPVFDVDGIECLLVGQL